MCSRHVCPAHVHGLRVSICIAHAQGEYIRDSLGREVRPLTARAQHAVVIAREHQSVGADDSKTEFDIELAVPAMSVDEAELLQVKSLNT